MTDWGALRAGVNARVKRLAALRYRKVASRAAMMSADECVSFQAERLREICRHAVRGVPYYRHRSDEYSLPAGDRGVDELLRALPVMDKGIVRMNNEALWMEPLPALVTFHATSGTSGTPLRLPATLWERALTEAALSAWIREISEGPIRRTLVLSGFMTPHRDGRLYWYDPLTRTVYLSIYGIGPSNATAIRRALYEADPDLVYGYASAVHQLALVLREDPLGGTRKRTVVTTSEVLYPGWRAEIEKVLGRVFDLYGSQEGCHMVTECRRGSMHVNPLIGIVEVLDQEKGVAEGRTSAETGSVVVTGLARRTMPLIRYELGDVASLVDAKSPCGCGCGWPRIERIEGRSEDLVWARDGSRIGYLCFHATKNARGVREAQLVQRGYDEFVCRVVWATTEPSERSVAEAQIRAEVVRRVQSEVAVRFESVESIPRGANGKFKAVVVDFDPRGD